MYHIIINPASRSGRGLRIWKEQIEPVLHQKHIAYRSYFSKAAGDVSQLISEIWSATQKRPLTIIILGGDGTINEALQGIEDFSQLILGYIPTGSSNDLARDLAIPTDPLAALDLILHTGKVHTMDLGTITYQNGQKQYFAVSCGIGFDAAVCEEALHSTLKRFFNKIGLGKLTYLGIALKQLFAAQKVSCRITLDNHPPIDIKRVLFVACMVHRYEGGGFMFCPDATAADGHLHLCTVGDLPKLLILFALPTAFWGRHYIFKGITSYQAKHVKIEVSTPLWIHTDGEVLSKSSCFTASCIPNALQIIAP